MFGASGTKFTGFTDTGDWASGLSNTATSMAFAPDGTTSVGGYPGDDAKGGELFAKVIAFIERPERSNEPPAVAVAETGP